MTPRKLTVPARVVPEAKVMAERWEIAIADWEPVRVNQLFGCHWSIAARRKKSVTRMIGMFSPHVPKATGKRRVTLKITLAPRMRADPDCGMKSSSDNLMLLMFGMSADIMLRAERVLSPPARLDSTHRRYWRTPPCLATILLPRPILSRSGARR